MKNESVKQLLIPYELTFNFVMTRLKLALGMAKDSELCALIGMSTSNYANRKRSESIPFEVIIPLAISRSVSLDWLLTGLGESHVDGRIETLAQYPPIDIVTIGDVAVELVRTAVKDRRDSQSYLREGRKMAQWAAIIYNKVAPVKDRDLRIALIRADVELLAAVDALSSSSDMPRSADLGKETSAVAFSDGRPVGAEVVISKAREDVAESVAKPSRKSSKRTVKR